MNKKVISSMLILCVVLLLVCYVLKLFSPEKFVLIVENEQILKIGSFVDSHRFVFYILSSITSFITYWLFMCACKRSWYLTWKEVFIIVVFILSARLINFIDVNVATHLSIVTFFIIPLIRKYDLGIAVIVYTVHGLSQTLSLGIRNLPMYMSSVNTVSLMICGLETYVWLTLFYIIFNYSKEREVKLWDWLFHHTTEQKQ